MISGEAKVERPSASEFNPTLSATYVTVAGLRKKLNATPNISS